MQEVIPSFPYEAKLAHKCKLGEKRKSDKIFIIEKIELQKQNVHI